MAGDGYLDVTGVKRRKNRKKKDTNQPKPNELKSFRTPQSSSDESQAPSKSVFTRLAQKERKGAKQNTQSVEGFGRASSEASWQVVATSKNSTFDSDNSSNTHLDSEARMNPRTVKSAESLGKKRKTIRTESKDEDQMMDAFAQSRKRNLPSLMDIIRPIWRFLKGLDLRFVAFVAVAIIALSALKLGEESYGESRGGGDVIDANLYEVLNVPKSTGKKGIERAYRKLTVEWHPDRNPDCPQCIKKFQEISHAYQVLSNKQSREIYDRSSSSFSSIESRAITLTEANYDQVITDTMGYKVWVIQAYSDLESLCQHVAPAWEEAVVKLGDSVGFARINARTDKKLLNRLPVKVRIYPTIMLLAKDRPTEIFGNLYQITAFNFKSWILKHFPIDYQRVYDMNQVERFLRPESTLADKQQLIITSIDQSLPLALRSLLLYHSAIFSAAHILVHEAKAGARHWNLEQPESKINIVTFGLPMHNATESSPVATQVLSFFPNSSASDTASIFKQLRKASRPMLTTLSSPVICGNQYDPPESVCLVRLLDRSDRIASMSSLPSPVPSVDFKSDAPSNLEDSPEKSLTGRVSQIVGEATGRVATAAQVLMHGAKKVCNFDESEFWRGLRRNEKRDEDSQDDDDESDNQINVDKIMQLTFLHRPSALPYWLSSFLSWAHPITARSSYLACHRVWNDVLKDSDLFIFQRKTGRLLPLKRVETSLDRAVELAADIFYGFVDIDVSARLRFLSAVHSSQWRGEESGGFPSLYDGRLLSCAAPISVGTVLQFVWDFITTSKVLVSCAFGSFGLLGWWFFTVCKRARVFARQSSE